MKQMSLERWPNCQCCGPLEKDCSKYEARRHRRRFCRGGSSSVSVNLSCIILCTERLKILPLTTNSGLTRAFPLFSSILEWTKHHLTAPFVLHQHSVLSKICSRLIYFFIHLNYLLNFEKRICCTAPL